MNLQRKNHTSGSTTNLKIIALVLVIFVGGMVLGIILLQFTNGNDNNASQIEEIEIKNANIWVVTDEQSSQVSPYEIIIETWNCCCQR